MHRPSLFILCTIFLNLLLLVSCSLGGAAGNATDPNVIYTSAAQTVAVQLTANAALHPSPTGLSNPAAISSPVNSLPSLESPTSTAGSGGITATPAPVNTITISPVVNDRADWVSQNPTDGSVFSVNQSFSMTWVVKNSGQTTWNTNYQLRFFSGDRLGQGLPVSYPLQVEVKPGETIQLSIPMVAPLQPGEFTSNWVLTNQELLNFYPLFVTIKVTSATLTPTPTLTMTITPTPTLTLEAPAATP
jgi:hypothetical protein